MNENPTNRELLELVDSLAENIAILQASLSQLIARTYRNILQPPFDTQAIDLLRSISDDVDTTRMRIGEVLTRVEAFIPATQTQVFDCMLPNQPCKQTEGGTYFCQGTTTHTFCGKHKLRRCVLCDTGLKFRFV